MDKIKTIIIEDEPLVRERIQNLLSEDVNIQICASCKNGKVGIEAIKIHEPQLLLLDIQTPLMNGIEVLERLPTTIQPVIIFVTAFDEYAMKAFEFGAIDYLLKPFDRTRFYTALERAKNRISERVRVNSHYRSYFVSKENETLTFVLAEKIIWATSSGNYVMLHTDEKQFSVRKTLKELETELDPLHFRRIHRSAIVNIGQIAKMNHLYQGDYRVEMTTGKLLTTSKAFRKNLNFILGKR